MAKTILKIPGSERFISSGKRPEPRRSRPS